MKNHIFINIKYIILIFLFVVVSENFAQAKTGFQIARLKYGGGGDWYNDPSSEVNLLNFVSEHTTVKVIPEYTFADVSTDDIFAYPFLFLTGHGNIVFSENEIQRLRKYVERSGFIYVDDDYGLDKAFRREAKKIFPNNALVELPFDYGLYHIVYDFNSGPPKIHKHNGKPAQGFGIFIGKRLVLYYTYESNPADGWADEEAHHDPQSKRLEALKFGTNLVVWALMQ